MPYRDILVLLSMTLLFGVAPAAAQTRAGRVANSSVGVVGQRQARAQAVANINPGSRVDGRIQNRVQSRIRNRIDRNYDPQANALSPFKAADDQARIAGGTLPR